MDFRSSFPQGKAYTSKNIMRKEEERLRLRKEKKLEEKKRANQRIKKANKKTEEEKKAKKAADFEKLKQDILAQSRREPIKNCPAFNFVEPSPGCHYDIGNSLGYVLIPIPSGKRKPLYTAEEFAYLMEKGILNPDADPMGSKVELSQNQLLEFIHENTYNITEQIFDNFGGRVDVQIITVTQWGRINEEDEKHMTEEAKKQSIDIRIHNTKFFQTHSRNNIFNTCDAIVESLDRQYIMHVEHSGLHFSNGIVMKLQYRINRSHEKKERTRKYKGGSYIDHFDIPCFTKKLRITCVTRMNNYNTKKEATYIYNIVNPNDNLCFLRYIILIKFLSVAEQRTYLNNFNIPQILPPGQP